MATWVLIIWMSGAGKGIASIPGYDTKAACEAAVAELHAGQADKGRYQQFDGAVCISGPKK